MTTREAPQQRLWPKGEMARRLLALGWSMRGYADELGVNEQVLRRLDDGEPLYKAALLELRARVFAWLDLEERLRVANPMPRVAGAEPGGVAAKQRRRRGPRGGEASEPSEGEAEGGAAVPAEASENSEVRLGYVRLELPDPELPDFDIGPDAPIGKREVGLLLELLAMAPGRFAREAGAPAIERTVRRWLHPRDERDLPKPETAAWLREIFEVLRGLSPEVTAFVRFRGMVADWMTQAGPRERAVVKALGAPVPKGIEEWEEVVAEVLRRRPRQLAPYAPDAGEGAGLAAGSWAELLEDGMGRLERVLAGRGIDYNDRRPRMLNAALRRTWRAGLEVEEWVRRAAETWPEEDDPGVDRLEDLLPDHVTRGRR